MGSARVKFTDEYKKHAVELVNNDGATIAGVAEDLGIGSTTLGNWVKKWRQSLPEPDEDEPLNESERRELIRLRAEAKDKDKRLSHQEMELRFAKKVAAWLAKDEQ